MGIVYMMVVIQVVPVDASAPTPQQLIAICSNDGPLKVAPHCPNTIPMLFISLPCTPGLYSMSPPGPM